MDKARKWRIAGQLTFEQATLGAVAIRRDFCGTVPTSARRESLGRHFIDLPSLRGSIITVKRQWAKTQKEVQLPWGMSGALKLGGRASCKRLPFHWALKLEQQLSHFLRTVLQALWEPCG